MTGSPDTGWAEAADGAESWRKMGRRWAEDGLQCCNPVCAGIAGIAAQTHTSIIMHIRAQSQVQPLPTRTGTSRLFAHWCPSLSEITEERIYWALSHHTYNVTKVYRETRTQDLLCTLRYKHAGHCSMPTYYGVLCSVYYTVPPIAMILNAVHSENMA
jgi:hypothetical protein